MGRGRATAASAATVDAPAPRARDWSARLRSEADQLASALIDQGAEAIALFGSVARGEAKEGSDIDMLCVWSGDRPRLRDLELPETSGEPGIAFVGSWERVTHPQPGHSTFFLRMLAPEAILLHDPDNQLAAALESLPRPGAAELRRQAMKLQSSLSNYKVMARFGGVYHPMLSDCYRWVKSALMVANLESGIHEPDRDRAIAAFSKRHPELTDAFAEVSKSEPHYLSSMGKYEGKTAKYSEAGATAIRDAAQEIIDAAANDLRQLAESAPRL